MKPTIRGHLFCQMRIGSRTIFDKKVVANESTVRANDRSLASKNAANSSGNNSIPVEIATTEEISATRNGDWQTIAVGIGLSNQVAARFAYVVGMIPGQRRRLIVRQVFCFAICLIRGRNNNLRNVRATTTRL